MEKGNAIVPEKSGSFAVREDKKQSYFPIRNMSVNYIMSHMPFGVGSNSSGHNHGNSTDHHVVEEGHPQTIVEEDEADQDQSEEQRKGGDNEGGDDNNHGDSSVVVDCTDCETTDSQKNNQLDFGSKMSDDIDRFLSSVSPDQCLDSVPFSAIEKSTAVLEKDIIGRIEYGEEGDGTSPKLSRDQDGEFSLLKAIDKLAKLVFALEAVPSESRQYEVFNRTSSVLQDAMMFLEDELRSLLEESKSDDVTACVWTPPPPSSEQSNSTSSNIGEHIVVEDRKKSLYPEEIVEKIRKVADTMISAGYEIECYHVFVVSRRCSLEAALVDSGFEKISIEDVQKMPWENLESEIVKWNTAFKKSVSVSLSLEIDFCNAVFSSKHPKMAAEVFTELNCGVMVQLLNFVEAVAISKRSAEKLFKFLDMYETLRDFVPNLEVIEGGRSSELLVELYDVRSRLGETVVKIFTELENSIRFDNTKTTVPGGAVHPLTRYVMNYVKYACEYKNTLVQLFEENQRSTTSETPSSLTPQKSDGVHDPFCDDQDESNNEQDSDFAREMMAVMDLLEENLEAKSKLYKDAGLNYIFLMNNGRYIMQKVKSSPEIKSLLGDTWSRKRSSDLRQYHKTYQRETWSKVLHCLRDEGLTTSNKGHVSKPLLKERFKSFNALFEEIYKTQSAWVISDEQLQSELRVSISAVVVPAYRSFLGRFSQYLDAGRQTEKYIKFGPEELESCIDELFEGNSSSAIKRRA